MSQPVFEIDQGDNQFATPRAEMDPLRRARQEKLAREMEYQDLLKRQKRMALFVKLPLALIVLGGLSVVGCDYAGVLRLGIFPHDEPKTERVIVRLVAPARTALPAPAPVAAFEPAEAPVAVPVVLQEPVQIDPAAQRAWQDKLARANNGVRLLTKDRDDTLAKIAANQATVKQNNKFLADCFEAQSKLIEHYRETSDRNDPPLMSEMRVHIDNLNAQITNAKQMEAHNQSLLLSITERLSKAAQARDEIQSAKP